MKIPLRIIIKLLNYFPEIFFTGVLSITFLTNHLILFVLFCVLSLLYYTTRWELVKKDFKHSKCIVTGGAQGIGRLIVEKLLKEGATIIILDIKEKKLTESIKEFNQHPKYKGRIFGYVCDISNKENLMSTLDKIKKNHGFIDCVVNNAGVCVKKTILNCSDEEIDAVMKINAISHMWIIKKLLPDMKKNNKGHIVTIASLAGILGVSGISLYSSSKFAAFGFNESLRLQLKKEKKKIDVLLVCPYFIDTEMFKGVDFGNFDLLNPEYVARRVIKAMKNRKTIIVLPDSCRILTYLNRLFAPGFLQDFLIDWIGISRSIDSILDAE